MDSPSSAQPIDTSTEDKTVAIIAYITFIGFIIALIMHGSKKTQLGAFHLRQVLGLILTSIVGWIGIAIVAMVLVFIPVIGPIVAMLLWLGFGLGLLVLFIMGLIAAVNGQQKPMPVVGDYFAKWFAGVF